MCGRSPLVRARRRRVCSPASACSSPAPRATRTSRRAARRRRAKPSPNCRIAPIQPVSWCRATTRRPPQPRWPSPRRATGARSARPRSRAAGPSLRRSSSRSRACAGRRSARTRTGASRGFASRSQSESPAKAATAATSSAFARATSPARGGADPCSAWGAPSHASEALAHAGARRRPLWRRRASYADPRRALGAGDQQPRIGGRHAPHPVRLPALTNSL